MPFSQVLTADPLYIVHGAVNYKMNGSDRETGEAAYGVYTLEELQGAFREAYLGDR